jgi:hypothetical protein
MHPLYLPDKFSGELGPRELGQRVEVQAIDHLEKTVQGKCLEEDIVDGQHDDRRVKDNGWITSPIVWAIEQYAGCPLCLLTRPRVVTEF